MQVQLTDTGETAQVIMAPANSRQVMAQTDDGLLRVVDIELLSHAEDPR